MPEEELLERALEVPCGGYFMGKGGSDWMRQIVSEAQKRLPVKAVISGDHEFGCQCDHGTGLGRAMNAGAIQPLEDAVELAYHAGRCTAQECRASGIRWSLGPVLDLNLNPDNPIVNTRAFGGSHPTSAAAVAMAYARGMQEQGMAACMKHFPGDGADARDQHSVTSINPLSEHDWMETYGKAFQAGIDSGILSMMVGHIAWRTRSGRHPKTGFLLPATVDPRIQVDLLREELGFQGLVLTDAIPMGGLQSHFSCEAEYVVETIRSGADMVLFPEDLKTSVDALEKALCDGYLSEKRVDDAFGRVLAFKAKLGLLDSEEETGDRFRPALSSPMEPREKLEVSRRIAERSVTLVRDLDGLYPLRLPEGSKLVLFEMPFDTPPRHSLLEAEGGDRLSPLETELRAAGYRTVVVRNQADAERETADACALFHLFFSTLSPRRGSIRLGRAAMDAIAWKRAYSGFPVYFVSFGNPYIVWELGAIHNYVCCYSRQPQVIKAYARALLGQIPFRGKLPVDLPEQ